MLLQGLNLDRPVRAKRVCSTDTPVNPPTSYVRSPAYKRIGIIGGVALLRREAQAFAQASEGRAPGDPGAF